MPKTADRLAPDWGHWLNMASVTLNEALLLSLNLDPRVLANKNFASMRGVTNEDRRQLKSSEVTYDDRFREVESALFARTLSPLTKNQPLPLDCRQTRVQLSAFVNWTHSLTVTWNIPTEMRGLAEKMPAAKDSPREISSYQKLLISLVVQHYQYDPDQIKSSVPSKLKRLLTKFNLVLDDETIRKCLRNSARYLSKEDD